MKIERLELFKVPPRWLFVKITTRSGLTGWGEPVLEGRTNSVAGAVNDLKEFIIGQDASNIEDIYNVLYKGGFYRGGVVMMSAISGIEQALWDIKGKALNTPVYNLLGGPVRDRVRVYVWIGGDTPDDLLKQAEERMRCGFTAVKMNVSGKMEWIINPSDILNIKKQLAELRAFTGNELGIGLDFHGRIHKSSVKRLLSELEEYYPMFYEEPVLPECSDQLKEVASFTNVPLALGERLVGRREFKNLISEGIVDIIQPDLSHAGGIWETRKIAAMAEAFDIALAPHCPLGPIAFSASLQINACTPNAIIQETSMGIHYNERAELLDYVLNKDDFQIVDGFIPNLTKPGLGVVIDEEFVKEMAKTGHNWRNPLWRGEDGSLLEW